MKNVVGGEDVMHYKCRCLLLGRPSSWVMHRGALVGFSHSGHPTHFEFLERWVFVRLENSINTKYQLERRRIVKTLRACLANIMVNATFFTVLSWILPGGDYRNTKLPNELFYDRGKMLDRTGKWGPWVLPTIQHSRGELVFGQELCRAVWIGVFFYRK